MNACRSLLVMSLTLAACGKASAPAPAARCDVVSDDHDAIYRRAIELIEPHMILVDRKAPPAKDDEIRVGIACLDRLLVMAPANWAAMWMRGKAFESLGDHASAVDSFRPAYQLQPDNPDVGRELVAALLQTRQFHDAVAVATEISDWTPQDAGLKANLALALLLDGQVDAAGRAIDGALQLDPDDTITQGLARRIREVASGARPRPKSMQDLQR